MIVSAGAGELDGAKANAAGVTTREAPVSRSKSARAGTTVCLKLPRRARLELGESTARTSVGRIVPVPLSVKSGAEPALRQLCDDGAGHPLERGDARASWKEGDTGPRGRYSGNDHESTTLAFGHV
jgi:hypothetical protein